MATRRVGEPRVLPSAKPEATPTAPAPVYGCLTDSLEANRVRTPVGAGTTVTIRCGLTSRPLTLPEQRAFRNEGVLPDGVGVSPSEVACTVEKPAGDTFDLDVRNDGGGIYSTAVDVDRFGTWRYVFSCPGSLAAPVSKEIPVKRGA